MPDSPKIRALIYDCGNTLLRTRGSFVELCEMVAAEHGHRIDPVALERALPHTATIWYRNTEMYRADHSARAGWSEHYADALAPLLALPREEAVELGGAIYDWYTSAEQWEPYPEVEEALAEGKRRGLIQGVLSDWGSDLLPILSSLGLTRHLDFVVVSAVIGLAKPGAEIFAEALLRAGVGEGEALYVGDTYVADILGARAAGIRGVLLDREGTAPEVDCPVIARLDEAFPLVEGASS